MPPIGETLREARVRQKIDIAEVETATKIRAKYLRALENEEFDRLPGATYVRTFLRTYSEFLGLDPHLLVEEYRVGHEPPAMEDAPPLTPTPAPPRRGEGGGYRPPGTGGWGPGRGAIVAGAVIGVLLLFLVVGLVTGGDQDSTDAGAPGVTDATKKRRGADKKEAPPSKKQPSGDEVKLEIKPTDATYVCIDDGQGERVFEGTLEAPRTFRAKTLLLNLGRTSAELRANGKPIDLPQSAEPVGYEFTPDGEQELSAGERPCA